MNQAQIINTIIQNLSELASQEESLNITTTNPSGEVVPLAEDLEAVARVGIQIAIATIQDLKQTLEETDMNIEEILAHIEQMKQVPLNTMENKQSEPVEATVDEKRAYNSALIALAYDLEKYAKTGEFTQPQIFTIVKD